MKLMVIGGGGREHAIIKSLKKNPTVTQIFALPGNAGMEADAVCVNIGAKDIPAIVETQKKLLDTVCRYVKKGGTLVYSTCSILRMENEDVVGKCIARANAEVLPIEHELLQHVPQLPVSLPGTLCVGPDELHEGFFVARIRRRK